MAGHSPGSHDGAMSEHERTTKSTTRELLVEIVVPVFNEEAVLESTVRRLHRSLAGQFEERWRITIADNASIDRTPLIANRLAEELDRVGVLRIPEKGRGRALNRAWLASPARVVGYVDADLSTDLRALAPLIAPLLSEHSDVAIGTRLNRAARVVRGARRELVSRSYNTLLRTIGVRVSDAQCGFKAMRGEVAQRLLPHVSDTGWFFDTELLMLAECVGLRIHEVPVDWIDDPESKVDVVPTAVEDIRGVLRVTSALIRGRIPISAIYSELGRRPLVPAERPGFLAQVARFAAVGAASTVAYAMLFLLLQTVVSAQVANFLALLLTAIANTWANRMFTFGVRGPDRFVVHQVKGLVVFGLAWALTSGSLGVLTWVMPGAGPTVELLVLTGANLLATLLRFALLRVWVFRPRRDRASRDGSDPLDGVESPTLVATRDPA